MADPSSDRGAGIRPGREPTTGPPRWVKVFGIIALVVAVLFVVLLLTGGPGRHGPGRHIGGLGSHPAPDGLTTSATFPG